MSIGCTELERLERLVGATKYIGTALDVGMLIAWLHGEYG